MSSGVCIYIEGGGNNDQNLERLFRRSWTVFLRAAELTRGSPRVVRGGARERTFRLFRNAVMSRRPNHLPLLLVDSEAPVADNHGVWHHLQTRDGWTRPPGTEDDQAFLMVQVMESWFLADRQALRRYFGPRLSENALKQWAELERVPKATVVDALKRATAGCPKPYAKGRVSFEVLTQVSPGRVVAACPHAKAFLDKLRNQ